MDDNYNCRLEYNEKQGCFHFAVLDIHEANTFGWATLCKELSNRQATEFTKSMKEKYPSIGRTPDHGRITEYPSLKVMQAEFESFVRKHEKVLQNS